jgi:predicted Na+-dependent transporter
MQGQRATGQSARRGMSDLTAQVLGVIITFVVFGSLAYGLNLLFASMAAG